MFFPCHHFIGEGRVSRGERRNLTIKGQGFRKYHFRGGEVFQIGVSGIKGKRRAKKK